MEIVQNITRQKDCTWSLVVQAKDLGSPSFSTTTVVNIDITEDHLKGPMAAFLMRSRDNPMKAVVMVIGIISVLVGVTAMLSAALFLRNSKSNKIMPARRIIKRRPRDQQQQQTQQISTWRLSMPLFRLSKPGEKFLAEDTDASGDCETSMSPRAKPPPPNAPLPPPPPCVSRAGDRPRSVPTISGALATKASSKAKANRRKEGNISAALVSELKMKLEQKIIESNKGYYC
uniref:Cadherin cytoplasmic C-terminal domain-containing protein n=1 Tax=Periophthalmus magnuspinnatus TaxID=409849 RepID=A0A3B4B996_9GOBI